MTDHPDRFAIVKEGGWWVIRTPEFEPFGTHKWLDKAATKREAELILAERAWRWYKQQADPNSLPAWASERIARLESDLQMAQKAAKASYDAMIKSQGEAGDKLAFERRRVRYLLKLIERIRRDQYPNLSDDWQPPEGTLHREMYDAHRWKPD